MDPEFEKFEGGGDDLDRGKECRSRGRKKRYSFKFVL